MKNLREFVRATVRESLRERDLFNEVRYIKSKDIHKETPLKDTETIRVYHGFNKFDDAVDVLKNGLSGKERAKRIYSYEMGNNPYGLFVTVDFNVIKRGDFAHSGVIIEFSTKVSDLEAPVWVGGRSYFIQGEYAHSFKNLEEREQQRLINRQRAGQSPYDFISKSDRPELADTIFDNPEKQALYIGDLNPNMIKAVWYNEVLHKDRLTRFQYNFIESMFKSYGVEIIYIENKDISEENDLVMDVISLIASFSGKIYGRRSAQRKSNKRLSAKTWRQN